MSRKDKRKRDKAGTKVPAASEQLADAAVEAATSADAGKRSDRAVWRVLLSLVLLLAVVGLPLYLLTLWRLPTRVVVDLVVNRVVFALGDGEEAVPILPSSTSFRALTVEGFERVAFTPKRLEFFSLEARASAGRWIPVSSKGELVLQGVGANGPSLSIEGVEAMPDAVGRLEALSAQPASIITVQVVPASPPALTVKIEGHTLSPSILPVGVFELAAQHAELKGLALPLVVGEVAKFRVALGANSPYLETVSHPSGLIVTITAAGSAPIRLLEKSGAAIKSIDFATQKTTGNLETTLAGPGQVIFADYPKKRTVVLAEHDFIRLADLSNTSITTLVFDIQKQSLFMRMEGTVGQIFTKSGFLSTDHRATVFDRIIYNAYLEYAVGFITLLGTMIGVWVKWHEVSNIIDRVFRSPSKE